MGNRYMANCSKYPYKGHSEFSIESRYFLVFALKVLFASRKYKIIDIYYRNCKE